MNLLNNQNEKKVSINTNNVLIIFYLIQKFMRVDREKDWIGEDWIREDWIGGEDWIGEDWIREDWIGGKKIG